MPSNLKRSFFCKFTALPWAHAWLPVMITFLWVFWKSLCWQQHLADWHHSFTVASLMMFLESGHTARTHCCNFSIMRTAAIETSPSHMNMEARSHIWMFGQSLRTAKSSPTSTRSRQTHTNTYCQQVTILHTSARTSRMASDYAFVWSSASRKPWNFVWRNCPRFSPRVAILKVLLLSSLIVFAKNRGKPSWTPTGKEHQSQTMNKQELHLCADGVLSCPRCSLFWRVPSPSLKRASARRSSSIFQSWRTSAQRTLEIFWYTLDHLDQPVTKTLLMAHASVGRHDARRVPWFKISKKYSLLTSQDAGRSSRASSRARQPM